MHSWLGRKPLWIGALLAAGVIAGVATMPRASNAVKAPEKHEQRLVAMNAGTVKTILVNEGQIVEAGEDIVMLEDTKEQEALLIAQGELAKISSEARGSGIAVTLPDAPPGLGGTIVQTGPMQVRRSMGGDSNPKKVDPLPGVGPSEGPSGVDPKPDPKRLAVLKDRAKQEIADANSEAERYAKEIDDAKLELEEAERSKETSRIITDRAKLAAERAKTLLAQGAISVNESARLDGQARLQQGILDANSKKADDAKAKIETLTSEREKALQRASEAQADLVKAPQEATPVASVVKPTKSVKSKPLPEVKEPRYARPAVIIPHRPEASTAPAIVEIDKTAKIQTDDKINQAKIKVDAAEAALLQRRIPAPRRMRIIHWLIKPTDTLTTTSPIAVVEFLPAPKKKATAPVANPAEKGAPILHPG